MNRAPQRILQQSGETWQRLTDFSVQLHVKNPGAFTLCGTNCFVVGRGPLKTLIDPGDFPERNQEFIANFTDYLRQNEEVRFNRILITHGHLDHFGGVPEAIKLLQEHQRATEDLQTFKLLTGNQFEEEVFERYPDLRDKVRMIEHGQTFSVDDGNMTIEALFTPGHLDDHMSFFLREDKTLVCGDVIIGAPSTAIQDLDAYFSSLGLIQSMDIDWLLLPHSVALNSPDLIRVEARSKIAEYVDYRVSRMNELLDCFKPSMQNQQAQQSLEANLPRTRQQLFDILYGPKNLPDNVKPAAYYNLDLQTDKLCKDGLLRFDEESETFSRLTMDNFRL